MIMASTYSVAMALVMLTCGVVANLMFYAIIGKVNQQLDQGRRFGYLGFHPLKVLCILREYRRLYPNGHLDVVLIPVLAATGLAVFLLMSSIQLR